MRFWRRHNLPSRVGTTKMSVLPSNFEVLEDTYISVAAKMILKHRVPSDLVYDQDEINAQFVSRPNKIKAIEGAKRIRLLGVRSEKLKINVTFALKETGDVVGIHQIIFAGRTKRCEPQSTAPANTSVADPKKLYYHTSCLLNKYRYVVIIIIIVITN